MKPVNIIKTILLALAVTLLSCSKEASRVNDPVVPPGISFDLSSVKKEYVNVQAAAVGTGSARVYTIIATKDPSSENLFSLTVKADSLRPGMYAIDGINGTAIFREGTTTAANGSGRNFFLNVFSNEAGTVTGAFSGFLYSGSTMYEVSVGQIKNITFTYR